jgi:hypothetical protein
MKRAIPRLIPESLPRSRNAWSSKNPQRKYGPRLFTAIKRAEVNACIEQGGAYPLDSSTPTVSVHEIPRSRAGQIVWEGD